MEVFVEQLNLVIVQIAINIDWIQDIDEKGTFNNDEELSQMYKAAKDSEIRSHIVREHI